MPSANGNEDEFDSLYDDDPLLDAALEESLAQVEASYTQAPAQLNANTKRGSFVPPFKRQRTDAPAAKPRHGKFLREPEPDEVIVHDLRNDDFMDQEDESWWASNKALDEAEQEAIRMSQQVTQRQASVPPAVNGTSKLRRQRSPSPSAISPKPAKDDEEIRKLKQELARLRELERTHQELTAKLKEEAYSKAGEVSVVRQNLTKLNQENAKLREREVAREQEHKAALDRLQLENQRQLERLETETTFRRVEQDTSRRIWPSSVMRVAPTGLRDTDRRRDSQVRAGLTTPTKSRRFESRGSGSGSRQRIATDNRDEPGTPTKSTTKGKQLFPPSANKSKNFKGFQNSFADFGAVQARLQQQQHKTPNRASSHDVAVDQFDDDVDMLQDDFEQPRARSASPAVQLSSSEHEREKSYLFALSEMLHRRTMVVSYVLCHTSPQPSPPITYPRSKFNPPGAGPAPSAHLSGETTLQRLTSSPLIAGCFDVLEFRYKKAVDSLLSTLSRANILGADDRWSAEEALFQDQIQPEDMELVATTVTMSSSIARSLLIMAGVALRTCQTNLVVDALRLMTSLASNVAGFSSVLQLAWTGPGSQDARDDELALQHDLDVRPDEAPWYATPVHLVEILTQSVAECRMSLNTDEVVSPRMDLELKQWDMGSDAREELLESVVQLLETIALLPHTPSTGARTLELLQRPGVLHQLLDKERAPTTIFKTVRLLASSELDAPFVHGCLAAKPAASFGPSGGNNRRGNVGMNGSRMKAKFPVLELLVKHLVDRRADLPEREWHPLHRVILIFLTQIALRSADTLTVLADSAALLAALVRCLSLDADFLWNQSRPSFMTPTHLPSYKPSAAAEPVLDSTGANVLQAIERLVMDVRLLNLLYNTAPAQPANGDRYADDTRYARGGPVSLIKKLDEPETYSMLNGIRQSFVVSLSRVAYCPEPEWISTERKFLSSLQISDGEDDDSPKMAAYVAKQIEELGRASQLLEFIADVAGDLIDLVLSPEEMDLIYDVLAEDESASEDEEVQLEAMQLDDFTDPLAKSVLPAQAPRASDSESEPEDYATSVHKPPASTKQHVNRVPSSVSPQKVPHSRTSTVSPDKRGVAPKTHRAPPSRTNSKSRQDVVVIDDSD